MRLTRSRDDVVVSGVLAGLGEYFKIDPTLLRIGAAILMFFSPFPVIPLYIIGAVLIPKAPKEDRGSRGSRDNSFGRNQKTKRDRDFEETSNHNEHFSSKVNDIDDEDWSDF